MSYVSHSAGKFPARALGGELREGKKAPYVAVEFKTHEGSVWRNFSLSETLLKSGKTVAEYSIADLIRCGWDGRDLGELRGLGTKEVELVIEHEPDDSGEMRANVRWINTPGERGNAKKADASKARQLSTAMRGRVLAAQKELGAAPAPRQAEPASDADDSVPF